jgi:hypothetical protein
VGEIYLFPLPALVGVVEVKAECLNFLWLEFIKGIPLVLLPLTHLSQGLVEASLSTFSPKPFQSSQG